MTFLLDTNHAIAQLNGDSRVVSQVAARANTQDTFSISTTVLGELFYGAYSSQRIADNLSAISILRSNLAMYEFDEQAADEFGKIQSELRANGKPIPTADAQIAAVGRLHGLTDLTNDAHFQSVGGLLTDNWLI